MRIYLSILMALGVAAGCRQGEVTSPLDRNIAAARAAWQNARLSDHAFVAARACECSAETAGPVRILVKNGAIENVTSVSTGLTVPASTWFTLDNIFDLVEREARRRPGMLEVAFDSTDGHPTRVKYGPVESDGGEIITITQFVRSIGNIPPG